MEVTCSTVRKGKSSIHGSSECPYEETIFDPLLTQRAKKDCSSSPDLNAEDETMLLNIREYPHDFQVGIFLNKTQKALSIRENN